MKVAKIFILLMFFISYLSALENQDKKINFHDFDKYQFLFTKAEVEKRIKKYLEKDAKIREFYKISKDALYIGNLKKDKIDYVLNFKTKKNKKSRKHKSRSKALYGLKIAIDPGHFGGMYSELEDRYTKIIDHESKDNKPIFFDEGTLTFLTAMELKNLLVKDGAIVFCTRSEIGRGTLELDFFDWLRERPKLWQSSRSLPHLFKAYYNKEDLLQRAEKINDFNPDLTIIIHYNTNFTQKDSLVKTNYSLAFVPGAFCVNELNLTRNRYEFLRLLVTDHIDESVRFSEYLVKHFVSKLKVPLISNNEITSYIDNFCMKQQEGVYSRNLALTRLIHSPVCYGETLIQNNREEVYRLSSESELIEGIACPKRLKEVAKAYYDGIRQYLKSN